MIVNYNHTIIMIVHYDPKTFIVQAAGFTFFGELNVTKIIMTREHLIA